MTSKKKLKDEHLKLYAILVEQLHKYAAIHWQFPIALLAANFFVLEKFNSEPLTMLVVSVLDGFLVFSFHRLVAHQRKIIAATKKTEDFIKQTSFRDFVPEFSKNKVKTQNLLVLVLYTS